MHELSVTRLIAAPPAKVWEVMTGRLEEWWCPKPWRAEFSQLDRFPGGVSRVTESSCIKWFLFALLQSLQYRSFAWSSSRHTPAG